MDTKRQFAKLREQFEAEKKKPLEGKDLNDAIDMLKDKFQQGKLF